MEKLKYGIEIEGAIKDTDFKMSKIELEREYDLDTILISKSSDFSANVSNLPRDYENKVEMKSKKPISYTDIAEHTEHWKLLLDKLGFLYNPNTCGLHIHISPVNNNWNNHFSTYMFNLYFSLSPFVRFFKNRRENQYCLSNGKYSKLMRFFSEDVNTEMSRTEFKKKWSKALNSGNFNFGNRNMLRIDSGYNTIEVRLFPPEIEILDTLIKLISRIWEVEGVLNASEMIEKSLYDVLKMYDLGEDLYKFKNYYEEWVK